MEFTKDDVLGRDELIMDKTVDARYFVLEGNYPNNQFWGSDGRCYVPARYKAKPRKVRVIIKLKVED